VRAFLLEQLGLAEDCQLQDEELWFEYELQCRENGEPVQRLGQPDTYEDLL